jgi:hypothetical protein
MIFVNNTKRFLFTISFLSFLAVTIATSTMMNNYEGSYTLQSVLDANRVSLNIPAGNEFLLDVMKDDDTNSNVYKLSFRIGNVLRSKMVVTSTTDLSVTDTIQMSGVSSTRMLPPPEVNAVEVGITNILRSATSIQYQDTDHNMLSIEGTNGSFTCKRSTT